MTYGLAAHESACACCSATFVFFSLRSFAKRNSCVACRSIRLDVKMFRRLVVGERAVAEENGNGKSSSVELYMQTSLVVSRATSFLLSGRIRTILGLVRDRGRSCLPKLGPSRSRSPRRVVVPVEPASLLLPTDGIGQRAASGREVGGGGSGCDRWGWGGVGREHSERDVACDKGLYRGETGGGEVRRRAWGGEDGSLRCGRGVRVNDITLPSGQ